MPEPIKDQESRLHTVLVKAYTLEERKMDDSAFKHPEIFRAYVDLNLSSTSFFPFPLPI